MKNISFFYPIFLGHAKAKASASKASGCFIGGNPMGRGGTGKAEAAKLPDAGISLKQCPEKMSGRKRLATELRRSAGHEPWCTIPPGSTVGLNLSGRSTVSTRMAMANALGDCG
jgi:hypothetical protein